MDGEELVDCICSLFALTGEAQRPRGEPGPRESGSIGRHASAVPNGWLVHSARCQRSSTVSYRVTVQAHRGPALSLQENDRMRADFRSLHAYVITHRPPPAHPRRTASIFGPALLRIDIPPSRYTSLSPFFGYPFHPSVLIMLVPIKRSGEGARCIDNATTLMLTCIRA